MEGYGTWEGSGGKKETGVLFSGRKVGCCGGGGGYYYCFLAITIMSRSRERDWKRVSLRGR